MSLLADLNSVGDAVIDGLESGTEAVGQWIDSGFDWAASAVGIDGVSNFLRNAGDAIASATGGAVDELDLGQTSDPKQLVRGETTTIAGTAKSLTSLADQLESTCTALGSIDTSNWTGNAATGFADAFTKQRQLWADAADAMISVAQQLSYWQQSVDTAQSKASDAIELWESAERTRASSGDGSTDAWSAKFRQAREVLDDARSARDQAAVTVAGAIAKATSDAPTEPAFTDRMLANLNDAGLVLEHGKVSAGKGLVNGITGIVQLARGINPTDPYNLTHPAQYVAGLSDKAADISQTVADPGAAVSAAWDGIKKNPFEAAGSLVGDAVLAAGTGGAGMAASVGRTGIRILDDAGDPTPDDAKAEPVEEQRPETEPDQSPQADSVEMQRFEATEFRNAKRSLDHFERHAPDFGEMTEEEYVQSAVRFFDEAQMNGYPAKFDEEQDRIRIYDPATNRFGSYYSDGIIATYYKPEDPDYWEDNAPGYGANVVWVE